MLHAADGLARSERLSAGRPAMTQRTLRVDELLREEISRIVSREIEDPRVGFVTITDVEVAADLRHATVWVSVIGTADERKATIRALGRAMPFVRHRLGELRIRRIPELHLRLDDSAEKGTRVLSILHELEAGHEPAPAPTAETLPSPKRASLEPETVDEAMPETATDGPAAGQSATATDTVSASVPTLSALTAADLASVPAAVVERLAAARTVLTVCHENPEADALGSALAHALVVEARGGRATAGLRRSGAADVRLHARHRALHDGPRSGPRLRPHRGRRLRRARARPGAS